MPSKSASVTSVSAVPGSKTSASGLSRRKVRRILISGEETSSNAELSNTRLPSTGANFIAESSMVTITLSPRIAHAPSSGSSPGFASSIPAIDRITAQSYPSTNAPFSSSVKASSRFIAAGLMRSSPSLISLRYHVPVTSASSAAAQAQSIASASSAQSSFFIVGFLPSVV